MAEHINRVAFGDTTLLRRGLTLMAEGFEAGRPQALAPHRAGSHMLDYGMLWVQSLRSYERLTAESQILAALYPVLTDFLQYLTEHENPTTGLLDIPAGHWSQTSLIDWAGADSRYGQSTALNAMYVGTLLDAAAIADKVGDSSRAALWRQKADTIKAAAQSHLYRKATGRYVTSIVQEEIRPPSPHAQAWALAYGLVPESEQQRVADALLQLLGSDPASPKVEIYGMFWVLEALGRTGRLVEALALIKQYYGRLLDLGATTWWETFNSHLSYTSTLSHVWGGSPTWFLSTYILGARRIGANSWQVQPTVSGLSAISGTLPLQSGVLAIEWNHATCDQIRLDLTSPSGSMGDVIVPFTSPEMELTLNGTTVWRDGISLADDVSKQADGVHITLASGQYTVEIDHQLDCQSLYFP